MRVVIFVEGGVVHDVTADGEVDIYVVDSDVEGAEEDRLAYFQDGNVFIGKFAIVGTGEGSETEYGRCIAEEVQEAYEEVGR